MNLSMRTPGTALLILLLCASATATASARPGERTINRSVSAGKAKSAHVELVLRGGKLTVSGGARHLLDATFTCDPPSLRPSVSYSVTGTRGHLVIRQPALSTGVKSKNNTWNVRLANRMPIDLDVSSGGSKSTLSLRTLSLGTLNVSSGAASISIDAASPTLRTLKATAGAGALTLNLATAWTHNVTADIKAAVGAITLHLPTTVGAQVKVSGMVPVTAPAFAKRGSAYVNSADGESAVAVLVTVHATVGSVRLVAGM